MRNLGKNWLKFGGSLIAVATVSLATNVAAQTAPVETERSAPDAVVDQDDGQDEILVTGSRIERAGFDQPTPVTVIGETELREGMRPNLQQVLNDIPSFRPTVVPQNSNGNVSASGGAPADLRGLGPLRTLTLLNGRRFIGDNNLNFVPQNLVGRVEVVTGGASAAYGSGAVAGVVNIILNDKIEGLSLGAQTGISGRGDGRRYGFDATFGKSFADERGHFIAGFEYVNDLGIGPAGRRSRPFLGAGQVRVDPTNPLDQRTRLTPDVNFATTTYDGLITSGVLAGQVFNQDGTLRPFRNGTVIGSQMIGGADGTSQIDNVYLTTPVKRMSGYARVSFDIGGATVWADGSYGRSESNYPFLYDPLIGALTIQSTNAFLSQTLRDRLAGAGQTSFTLGRYFTDAYTIGLRSARETYEGAIGIEGEFSGIKYRAHYSHGEAIRDEALENVRLGARYNAALNSVLVGGTPVCAINADLNPANDDPACSPINPFGFGNVSAAARAYTTGTQFRHSRNQLDSAAVELQADVVTLPAGPVTVVIGGEYRNERQDQRTSSTPGIGQFAIPVFVTGVNGGIDVKEGYAEIALPVIDAAGTIKVDLNGAARYSDYSNSGGIWSWKAGATVLLFDQLLLRGLRSRDIRAPSVDPELFTPQAIGATRLSRDSQSALYVGNPNYVQDPLITTYTGGNPLLEPETAKTITVGATYSPRFAPGLSMSADYYDISMENAIGTLGAPALIDACGLGNAGACNSIVRDGNGTVTTAFLNFRNLASLLIRGYDFELSYLTPLSRFSSSLPGTLRIRGLVNHVLRDRVNNGFETRDNTPDAIRWRGRLSVSYQNENIGIDARMRYLSGHSRDVRNDVRTVNGVTSGVVNNYIKAYAYFDLGMQFRVADRFTLFGNVNNLFDRDAPLETLQSGTYDQVGRYFSAGARVKF